MVDVIATPMPIGPVAAPGRVRALAGRRETSGSSSAGRPSSSATSWSSAGSSPPSSAQRITPYDPFNDFFAGHLPPSWRT